MRNELKIMLAGLSVLALASCTNESPQPRPDGEVSLWIVPTVIETGTGGIGATSRAKVGDIFPLGAEMGLGISAPSASPAIASFYDNFYGLNGGDAWRYYLNGINAGSILSGFSSWGDIELYGYYPYEGTATDLTAIPFSIATVSGTEATGSETTAMTDYMVAGTKTKDMTTPDPVGELSMEFGHMMTAIELFINRIPMGSNYSSPEIRLGSVTFEISGGREFVVSGTYNAINPDVVDIQNNINTASRTTATKMTVTYPSSTNIVYTPISAANPTPPARLLVIMPELRHNATAGNEDATVTMTFAFVDHDGSPYLLEDVSDGTPSITFDLSDISNTGSVDSGLLAGYSYGVTATIGTYTHFAAPTTGTPTPPHVNYTPLEDAEDDEFIDI